MPQGPPDISPPGPSDGPSCGTSIALHPSAPRVSRRAAGATPADGLGRCPTWDEAKRERRGMCRGGASSAFVIDREPRPPPRPVDDRVRVAGQPTFGPTIEMDVDAVHPRRRIEGHTVGRVHRDLDPRRGRQQPPAAASLRPDVQSSAARGDVAAGDRRERRRWGWLWRRIDDCLARAHRGTDDSTAIGCSEPLAPHCRIFGRTVLRSRG